MDLERVTRFSSITLSLYLRLEIGRSDGENRVKNKFSSSKALQVSELFLRDSHDIPFRECGSVML
jgi:hypothetical protein